ncbi:signal peptidase II [Phenylobacterium sp.]|jgi:signal peptidase II|uniref:signal peptidase II n=1 Tax=Phenylobacterium sp. TaxID=1871053 RepID=UPI002F42AFAB
MSKLGRLALALAVLVVIADQAVKYWILQVLRLQEGQSIPVFGPICLTGVWNPGVSFGFLQARQGAVRWLLVVFSFAVAAMLVGWVRRSQRPLFATAIGLVIGGAVGNAIDRIRLGQVADFIDASALYFPWIFNVADSAITIGICLLLLDMLRQDGKAGSAGGNTPGDGAAGDAA